MLGAGHDIGTTPELLGHSDVSTTMHCTHVLNRDDRGSDTGGRAGRQLLDIAAVLAGLVTAGVRFRAG